MTPDTAYAEVDGFLVSVNLTCRLCHAPLYWRGGELRSERGFYYEARHPGMAGYEPVWMGMKFNWQDWLEERCPTRQRPSAAATPWHAYFKR